MAGAQSKATSAHAQEGCDAVGGTSEGSSEPSPQKGQGRDRWGQEVSEEGVALIQALTQRMDRERKAC